MTRQSTEKVRDKPAIRARRQKIKQSERNHTHVTVSRSHGDPEEQRRK